MNRFTAFASVLLMIGLCSNCRAGIVWMRQAGDVDVSITNNGGKYQITIDSSDGGGEVWFWSTTNGLDTIEYIRNEASGTPSVGIRVKDNPDNGYLVRSVEEISEQTSATIVIYLCEVTHDVGDVDVWGINTIDAGGDITGSIESNATNITLIDVAGDITAGGSISAPFGQIIDVMVDGDIGTSGSPVSITAKQRIHRIIGNAVHANITVTGTTGGDGGVGRVESTGGDMTGTLTCFKLETVGAGKDIVVAGDLDMDITVADHILSDILIDGSLEGDIEVEDDDLLEGQIIINVADDSGEWNGDVIVNGTTLSTVPN